MDNQSHSEQRDQTKAIAKKQSTSNTTATTAATRHSCTQCSYTSLKLATMKRHVEMTHEGRARRCSHCSFTTMLKARELQRDKFAKFLPSLYSKWFVLVGFQEMMSLSSDHNANLRKNIQWLRYFSFCVSGIYSAQTLLITLGKPQKVLPLVVRPLSRTTKKNNVFWSSKKKFKKKGLPIKLEGRG